MKNKDIVFGIKPIIEVIKSGKTIDKLFIQKSLHNDSFAVLWKLVRSNRINYKHVFVYNHILFGDIKRTHYIIQEAHMFV